MYVCVYAYEIPRYRLHLHYSNSFSLFLSIPFFPPASAISNGETASKKYPDIYQGNDDVAKISAMLHRTIWPIFWIRRGCRYWNIDSTQVLACEPNISHSVQNREGRSRR